jgi:hypothetical protein
MQKLPAAVTAARKFHADRLLATCENLHEVAGNRRKTISFSSFLLFPHSSFMMMIE